jgi:hypothetical protein
MANERRTHHWIQPTIKKIEELKKKEVIPKNSGYQYLLKDGLDMVEYHVDSLKLFQQRLNGLELGGSLSVRVKEGERPLIIFDQNECIFKQYLLSKKAWMLPSSEKQLVPKDEGQGVMISALQSREFGYGLPLAEEQLNIVNAARVGQQYKDVEAAKKYKGNTEKNKLLTILFCCCRI